MTNTRTLVSWLIAAQLLVAQQRGGPPRKIENPETIQLAGGARVEFRKFHSPALGKEADYSVFIPPSYDKDSNRMFPVIYFLHGMNNNHTSWAVPRYGDIPARIESLMTSGKVPQFVMVHPNGENSFYTDQANGTRKYEGFICRDVIDEIEKNFRVRTGRGNRALGALPWAGTARLKLP